MLIPFKGVFFCRLLFKELDGKVYSVAQGAVSIGGLSAGNAGGANVQVNHPTVGIITNGALVEKEIDSNILNAGSIDLLFVRPTT